METSKSTKSFLNTKLDIKIKLFALWTTLMFLFVYADLKAIYQTGTVEAILKGEIIGMKIDDFFLLSSSMLMSIPAIMIFLTIIMKPKINRVLNLIFPCLFIFVNIGTYFAPGKVWYYYVYFTSLEYIICLTIIWLSWEWPKIEK